MRSRVAAWSIGAALSVVCLGAVAQGAGKLEIFSWWTTGGEAAGLLKLFEIAKKQQPGIEIINATVAGGAGQNAKAVLKTRMLGGDPPDSFQVHMGRELTDTWVVTGFMEPLDDLFKQAGWEQTFPKGVLELLKGSDGRYYSVPANIHRANVLWYNKKVFQSAGVEPPKTVDEFFKVADKLKGSGVTPLALGDNGIWAATHLFETVLIGSLGAEGYRGLWTGKTDWNGPGVRKALETMVRMLGHVNSDHAARSWDQANDLVIQGKAGMTIMGDWVDADNLAKGVKDVGWAPAPGNTGIYDALSDSFGLPKKAPHRAETLNWLKLVGSQEGQEAFNPLKGSICARTDCNPKLFGPYLQWAMEQWKKDAIVPSLAHGAAAKESWLAAINDAMSLFVTGKDVVQAQKLLTAAAAEAAKK
jgi:glucose/mannose transport system substrate-binding protein